MSADGEPPADQQDPQTQGRLLFRALSQAVDAADQHPDSQLLQRRASHLMAGWLAQVEQDVSANLPAADRFRHEVDIAAATVSENATRDGQRALDAGPLATAARHWRMAAVLDSRDTAEFLAAELGIEPTMLRLIELYLQMRQPHLAAAWCLIAGADGWSAEQIHPLNNRARQMIATDKAAGTLVR